MVPLDFSLSARKLAVVFVSTSEAAESEAAIALEVRA